MSGHTSPPSGQPNGQLSGPLRSFLRTESGGAVLLLAAAVLGLAWANSPWSGSYTELWETSGSVHVGPFGLGMTLGDWINDGLMAVFFFVVGLEVRREWSVGEFSDRSRVLLPVAAGVGGMLVPVALYLLLNAGGEAASGWGIVIGTDTAFLLGALALVGPACSAQLRVFLLALTVVDDLVAVTVIGVAYTETVNLVALVVAGCCLVVLALLGRFGTWRAWPYVVVMLVLWLGTHESGVHPSIAGMVAGLLVPAHQANRPDVEGAARLAAAFRQSPHPLVGYTARAGLARAVPVNERFQLVLHSWTSYVIVPIFALANAGVDLRGGVLADALGSPVTWGVVAGLVLGKALGISVGALGGQRWGLGRLPQGVAPGHVVGGAALSGIGFTVSLLIVELAFGGSEIGNAARVGVLLALVLSVLLGLGTFRLAARLRGETSASLPVLLDRSVDPGSDHIKGPAHARLTLIEYADFECPFCARATGVARELRAHFGDELRYVFRHLPLPDVHPAAEGAAVAAEAAARQGYFWEMHDVLFRNQHDLAYESLLRYAAELGLDVEQFRRDLADERTAQRVRVDAASADASGARSTPTFFVGERRHIGPHDTGSLIAVLENARETGPA